jgi:hypothetical protein
MYIRGDLGSSELSTRTSLNDSGIPSKFWWMDSNGDLTPVSKFGHAEFGKQILRKKYGIESESTFTEMYKKGYIRVGFVGLWGQYNLEINYIRSNPPSSKQWKALKDLAIEMGADSIRDDTSGREVRVNESRILFENFQENKEWFVYEGSNNITVIFEDNSRQTFKIHFHKSRGPDRDKWRTKAARTWKKLAMEFRKNAGLTEVGNPIVIPWQQCFKEALNHPEMKEYVDDLRATPIFEWINDLWFIWLSKEGEPYNVQTHERGGAQILQDMGINPNNYPGNVYTQMYQQGFARVVVHDNQYPLMVDTGTMGQPKLTKAQKEWLEDKSFELGLDGEYYTSNGRPVKENLCEMSYDDLRKSMKNYRIRRGGGGRTVRVGDNGREERSKHVRVKPLTVKSTVGKDGQERETSLFSYTSEAAWRTGGTEGTGHHGYIRFLESFDKGKEGDVEVNCNCEDYRYVWSKPNADAGVGTTKSDGDIEHYYPQFKGGGNDNIGTAPRIRNPGNVQGICKHLMAIADYLDTKAMPAVAKVDGSQEKPSPVAPTKPKKPINIFEAMKQFALQNPKFQVEYED